VRVTVYAAFMGLVGAAAAVALSGLIAFFAHLTYEGRLSFEATKVPDLALHLGAWAVLVPALAGVVIGLMARYGTDKIRGEGIPEAMDAVLANESRIGAKVAVLKPLSAALCMGSGGPFGAEGPIIQTGGAVASLIGQRLPISAVERKALLAAGAAAGMSAAFSAPIAASLIAIELLLFELRRRTIVPVAVAASVAFGARAWLSGVLASGAPAYAGLVPAGPLFPVGLDAAHGVGIAAILSCGLVGMLGGLLAALITWAVYAVEDGFERTHIHWMWWPAVSGLVVGLLGLVEPRILSVGYDNIADALAGRLALGALAALGLLKLLAWTFALGSGTSGGVLAPVLTIGGALGGVVGIALESAAAAHPALAPFSPGRGAMALVAMAACFGACTRTPLATVALAYELTGRLEAMPGVLIGVALGDLVYSRLMPHSIMQEKLARRGIPIGHEYAHDPLALLKVADVMTREVLTVPANLDAPELLRWLAPGGTRTQHGGYPVVDGSGRLAGFVTRKAVLGAGEVGPAPRAPLVAGDLGTRPVATAFADESLTDAADRLGAGAVGRLVVVDRGDPGRIVGILSRSDVIEARRRATGSTAARNGVSHAAVPELAPLLLPVVEQPLRAGSGGGPQP
jgi:H+/Cl- antiporter ClcA/CBS domain-containing protein